MTFPIVFNRKLDVGGVGGQFTHFQYLGGTYLGLIDNQGIETDLINKGEKAEFVPKNMCNIWIQAAIEKLVDGETT